MDYKFELILLAQRLFIHNQMKKKVEAEEIELTKLLSKIDSTVLDKVLKEEMNRTTPITDEEIEKIKLFLRQK